MANATSGESSRLAGYAALIRQHDLSVHRSHEAVAIAGVPTSMASGKRR